MAREQTGTQETLYVWGAGLAFQVNPDGTRRYYHTDALGGTRVLTDDSGQAVTGYNYDAYGAIRSQSCGDGTSPSVLRLYGSVWRKPRCSVLDCH